MARQFARGMRRKTQWAGFGNQVGAATLPISIVVTAGNTVLLSTNAIIAGAAGFLDEEVTIVRTIGNILALVDSDSADAEGSFAIGLYVTRAEAIAAGVGSLPSPEADPDAEWLYYAAGVLRRSATANINDGVTTFRDQFDVRSQRRLRSGESMVWLLSARTGSVRASVSGRYLAKLA